MGSISDEVVGQVDLAATFAAMIDYALDKEFDAYGKVHSGLDLQRHGDSIGVVKELQA